MLISDAHPANIVFFAENITRRNLISSGEQYELNIRMSNFRNQTQKEKTEVIQETQPLDEQFSCFFLSSADADNIKLSVITFILQVREKKKLSSGI